MSNPSPTACAPSPAVPVGEEDTDNAAGALWMGLSVAAATVMTLAVKELAGALDSRMIVFLRSAGIIVLVAPLLAWPAFRSRLRFSQPRLHLQRGMLIAVSTQFGFYGLSNLPVSTATVLNFTAPIFATLLAAPINGEQVGPRRWAAVGAGFVGALIILRPGVEGLNLAMLSSIASSLLFALALVLSRGVASADGPVSSFLSSIVLTGLLALPLALPVWGFPEGGGHWLVLLALVAASSSRSIGDLQAYRLGEAAPMGVLSYSRLVFIGAAAYVLFDERPDIWTLVGGAVIIGSSFYIAHRERLRGRARRAERDSAMTSASGPGR
ncbi:MAG: DMT family transporter [Pseudomonadota bacterium]|nr:DMT family transporter [Pseudomonadota bacterium]